MRDLYNILEAITLIACVVFLYRQFGRRPRIKAVKEEKIPTTKEIRKRRKRERQLRKVKRRFKIPYRGKTEVIKYSKTAPYIESAWNEVEKEQHGKKRGRGI
ncbi:MAG: hypothetical protein K2L82_07515 [Lachnospiraceae bacterium]|nr:hypothetical protein [Lachnospiraceae bacterium]